MKLSLFLFRPFGVLLRLQYHWIWPHSEKFALRFENFISKQPTNSVGNEYESVSFVQFNIDKRLVFIIKEQKFQSFGLPD